MNMQELVELTKVQRCPICELDHAKIRSCEEAALELRFNLAK